jgi:hypothetical protein
VLLPGSGAFCRPYHEWMPRALAIAEPTWPPPGC